MKRTLDICGAIGGLILLAPIMAAIALIIRLSSHGSVVFSQLRVGRHGRPFRVYKFRSMVFNAERIGTSVTTAVDRRITPVGRILRRTKLDELPQLWNVLKGDMSFIGPRPDVPEIVEGYTAEMRHIFDIRPGITSIATLYLRDEESLLALSRNPDLVYEQVLVPFKVALALEHVERNSLLFDAKVLLHTAWALTFGRFFSSPGKRVVEIIRNDILAYEVAAGDQRGSHSQNNWTKYRSIVQRHLNSDNRSDRSDGSAVIGRHSSPEGS
jgi:lipopolysaccharide/colanic/teichoic acid biosynthesis glycosyltransferase